MERGYAPLDGKNSPATAEKAGGPSAAISPRREVGLGGHNLAELRSIADWLIHNISLGKKTCPTAIDHRLAASRKQYLIYSPNLARFHFSSITDVSHCPPRARGDLPPDAKGEYYEIYEEELAKILSGDTQAA